MLSKSWKSAVVAMIAVSLERGQTLTMEWSPQRRKTDKIIRCPYCVEDRTFKAMLRHSSGDWFVCNVCGHLSLPSEPCFQCTCGKCVALKTMQEGLSPRLSGFKRDKR